MEFLARGSIEDHVHHDLGGLPELIAVHIIEDSAGVAAWVVESFFQELSKLVLGWVDVFTLVEWIFLKPFL